MDIILNVHFPERALVRMYIWPNGHLPENQSFRIDTCQNIHLMSASIIQDEEIKLFCSVSRVNVCFISGLVLRPCTVHFCIVLQVYLPHWKKLADVIGLIPE